MEPLGGGVLLKEVGHGGGVGGLWGLIAWSYFLFILRFPSVTFQLLVHALKSFLPVVKSLPP